MLNIAVTGLFDAFIPDFIRWFHKSSPNTAHFIGLSPSQLAMNPSISWRTGSLMSLANTTKMLSGIDLLVFFCLTPPTTQKTPEGLMPDVALCSAIALAKTAAEQNRRVLLITRNAAQNTHISQKNVLSHIETIFKARCQNLHIIRTDPVLSECDPISLAVYEHAVHSEMKPLPLADSRITAPVDKEDLYSAISCVILNPQAPADTTLKGSASLTWNEWIQIQAAAIPNRKRIHGLQSLHQHLKPKIQLRAALLEKSIAVSADAPQNDKPLSYNESRKIRRFAEDILDDVEINAPLFLQPLHRFTNSSPSTSYVQKILNCPNRDVSDFANLFMEWLPRFFRHTIAVDDIGSDRVLCRSFRVPLIEFEKIQETENRCRIHVICPWLARIETPISFVVMTTTRDNASGVLLILAENTPNLGALTAGIRGLLNSFGEYLKEYGCGC